MLVRWPKLRGRTWIFLVVIVGVLFWVNSPWFIKKTAYPMPYRDQVFYYSKVYKVDPYLVTAIMRVESKFKYQAESVSGARGLMQIMPETGQWVAGQIRLVDFDPMQLYEPERNIQIGCWYLYQLSQEFEGNYLLVLAAYNAGPGRVRIWISNGQWDGRWQSIDEIPFSETREYLKKVDTDYQMYLRLYRPN